MAISPTTSPASFTTTGTAYFRIPDHHTQALIQISGTYGTVTFSFEGAIDGTNVFPIAAFSEVDQTIVAGTSTISPTDNTTRTWILPCAGLSVVGVNVTAVGSGTATFTFTSGSYVGQPIVATTNTNNTTSGNQGVTGTLTVTSSNASALTVGLNGATNPAFQVDASTGSSATGIKVKSAAAGGGVAVSVVSSGTNENVKYDAKGSGTVSIGSVSTGNVLLTGGGGIVVVSGTLTAGGLTTCAVQIGTSGPAIYSGSGAPSISAALKGSLYLRSDGSSTSTRAYIATDNAGTWTAITTAG